MLYILCSFGHQALPSISNFAKKTLENSFIKVGRTEKFQCEQLLMLLQILEAQLLLYSPSMLATPSSVGHYHQQKKGMVLS